MLFFIYHHSPSYGFESDASMFFKFDEKKVTKVAYFSTMHFVQLPLKITAPPFLARTSVIPAIKVSKTQMSLLKIAKQGETKEEMLSNDTRLMQSFVKILRLFGPLSGANQIRASW
jgi:hypothetical protein